MKLSFVAKQNDCGVYFFSIDSKTYHQLTHFTLQELEYKEIRTLISTDEA